MKLPWLLSDFSAFYAALGVLCVVEMGHLLRRFAASLWVHGLCDLYEWPCNMIFAGLSV